MDGWNQLGLINHFRKIQELDDVSILRVWNL